jgi:F-type H+-transporting ATPase subunit epsilon
MHITVLTPDKEIFSGPIVSVKVPGAQGAFQVLKGHAPIVSSLDEGEVIIVTAAGEYRVLEEKTGVIQTSAEPGRGIRFTISGGFIEVLNNDISLLVRGVRDLSNNG